MVVITIMKCGLPRRKSLIQYHDDHDDYDDQDHHDQDYHDYNCHHYQDDHGCHHDHEMRFASPQVSHSSRSATLTGRHQPCSALHKLIQGLNKYYCGLVKSTTST